LHDKEIIKTTSISGPAKYVGLYFCASWCPPSRKAFTPMLAEWYNNFKTTHAEADNFEIVFVSYDKNVEAFNDYYNENMPWKALPYELRDPEEALREFKFKVRNSSGSYYHHYHHQQ
jgi:thiol-disulfide isomerase/thioredoxin